MKARRAYACRRCALRAIHAPYLVLLLLHGRSRGRRDRRLQETSVRSRYTSNRVHSSSESPKRLHTTVRDNPIYIVVQIQDVTQKIRMGLTSDLYRKLSTAYRLNLVD
jgi:hypothetical protein